MRALALLLCALATPALAQDDGGVQPDAGTPAGTTIFVSALEANPEAQPWAATTSQTLAFRLERSKLSVLTHADVSAAMNRERQAQLLGCNDAGCVAELGQAMGARFIVTGRLDKLGERFVLVASLWDAEANKVVHRARQEGDELEQLPELAKKAADELLIGLGIAPEAPPADVLAESGINLSARLGTQFFTSLLALSPQIDLELGWRFSLRWSAFLQLGAGLTFTPQINVTITPGLLGLRYNFRAGEAFQPVLGGGLGIFATLLNAGKVRPSIVLLGGAHYFFWPRLAVTLEASVDLLGAAFDFVEKTNGGINFGVSLGVAWRF